MTTMTRGQVLEAVREAEDAGRRTDLRGVRLGGVNLSDGYLGYSDFTGADLTDANLYNSDLIRADLTNTNLTGTDLIRAHLLGADLTDADLRGADLTDADLRGADLTGAWLGGAVFTPQQLLDARGLWSGAFALPRDTWGELLPASPQRRQLAEHLLNDGWGGTLREAIETVEGLAGR